MIPHATQVKSLVAQVKFKNQDATCHTGKEFSRAGKFKGQDYIDLQEIISGQVEQF